MSQMCSGGQERSRDFYTNLTLPDEQNDQIPAESLSLTGLHCSNIPATLFQQWT